MKTLFILYQIAFLFYGLFFAFDARFYACRRIGFYPVGSPDSHVPLHPGMMEMGPGIDASLP